MGGTATRKLRIISLLIVSIFVFGVTIGSQAAETDYFTNSGNKYTYNFINGNNGAYYNGKTYIAYNGEYMVPYITYYDHNTGQWGPIVKVGETKLSANDNHGTPCVAVDKNGYIHVIYGGHVNGGQTHMVSASPGNISSWNEQKDIFANGSYVQLFNLKDGRLFFMYRAGYHRDSWKYAVATTNGSGPATFGSVTTLLDAVIPAKAFYTWSRIGDDGAIHVTFVHHNDYSGCKLNDRQNLYYVKVVINEDGSASYYDGNGVDVTNMAPFSLDDANNSLMIYNSQGRAINNPFAYVETLADGSYKTHITANEYVGSGEAQVIGAWNEVHFTKDPGNANWTKRVIADTTVTWQSAMLLELDNQVQAIVNEEGSLDRYAFDGVNWSKEERIIENTTGAAEAYYLAGPVSDGQDEGKVILHNFDNTPGAKAYLWGRKNGISGFVTKNWPEPTTVDVQKDTFVNDGSKANLSFGADQDLTIKNDGTSYYRRGFMQFDTSSLTEEGTKAILKFKVGAIGGETTIKIYAGVESDFNEMTMNWNNQVSKGQYIGTVVVNNANGWYEADITAYMNNNIVKDKMVFVLESQYKASNQWIAVKSKESGSGAKLIVE